MNWKNKRFLIFKKRHMAQLFDELDKIEATIENGNDSSHSTEKN
jgi:hypothetical protein